MKSKLTILALAVAATLSIGAVPIEVASADFEFGETPVTLTPSSASTQKFELKEGGSTFECTTLTFDNSTQSSSPTTEVVSESTYGSCANFLGQSTSIHTNGCDYKFHLANGSTTGTADLECPSSTGIQVTIGSLCTYEYDTQTGLSSVTYQNLGSGTTEEIRQTTNLQSVAVTRTTNHPPFLCPAGGTNGKITGSVDVTGSAFGFHVGSHVD